MRVVVSGRFWLAGLFGVGLGTASADQEQPCAAACQSGPQHGDPQQGGRRQGDPGGPRQGDPGGPPPVEQRGIDQGRQDHQPFMYGGQQVNPVFDNGHGGWGFWFFGTWIPL